MIPLSAFFPSRRPITVSATNVHELDTGAGSSGDVISTEGETDTQFSGNVGAATFLWEHVSTASGNTPIVNNATLRDPVWSANVEDATDSVSTWRITVTDSTGRSGDTTITVTLDYNSTA